MAASPAPSHRGAMSRLFVKYWRVLVIALGAPLVVAVGVEAYYGYRAQLAHINRTQAVQAIAISAAVESSLEKEIGYMTRVYRVPWPERRLDRLADEIEIALALFPSMIQVIALEGARETLFVSQLEPRRVSHGTSASVSASLTNSPAARYSLVRLGPRQIPAILATIRHDRLADERLEVAIDLRSISDLLRSAGRRDAAVIYLVDGAGQVVAHSDPSLALGARDMTALPHLKRAREDPTGTREDPGMESVNEKGQGVLATVQPVAGADWLLVIERPLAEVIAPIRRGAWRTLLLLAIGVLAATMLGAALARRLTRPILELGHDVERIGRGELAHRSAIRTGDEIEALGDQVNDMAARLEEYTHGLERKVAERTAELEAALRTRALLLAAASHDLRQPLYAISILADTMAVSDMSADAGEVLGRQREAIAILRSLFDDLLDISRFDAGDVKPIQRDVALGELLSPIVLEADVLCGAKGLAFHRETPDVWVRTDPELLRRALRNLISNAVRYTSQGSVSISARVVGERLALSVIDTGIGIAAEDQGRIFDEFVQVTSPGRDREKGVGLGLSIARRISLLLDARLSVESEPGRGSTFNLSIPLTRIPPA